MDREMIFVQPFCNNFLSYIHIMFLFSLFIFFSLLFFTNKNIENESCHGNYHLMVVHISLLS